MTDGIRRPNPAINTTSDSEQELQAKANEIQHKLDLKDKINDLKELARNTDTELKELLNQSELQELKSTKLKSTEGPSLGSTHVRDSYETTRPLLNPNAKTPPSDVSDVPVKVDAGATDLLNQQKLSTHLGTPLFKKTQVSDAKMDQLSAPISNQTSNVKDLRTAPLSNRAQLLPGIQSALGNVIQDAISGLPSNLKKPISQLIGSLSEIQATETKIASEKDAASVNFVTSVASAAVALTGATTPSTSALNGFVNAALKAGSQSSAGILSESMQKIRDLIDSNNAEKKAEAIEKRKIYTEISDVVNPVVATVITVVAVVVATFTFGATTTAAQIIPVLDKPEIVSNVAAQQLAELRKKLEELLNS